MKTTIEREFGKLTYEESFWTGKKKIILNGQELVKLDKTTFQYTDEEGKTKNLFLTGNFVGGVKLSFDGYHCQLTAPAKWYEYALAIIGFAFVLFWSNVPALCEIFPVVGGAIGGGISGFMGFLSLVLMKSTKNPLFKILIGLGMIVATILACFIVALMIISVLV